MTAKADKAIDLLWIACAKEDTAMKGVGPVPSR